MNINKKTFFGSVAIVGRHNVGKSTLFNKLLGQKISITSCKVKTTLYHIIGIRTDGSHQVIYIDTPDLYVEIPFSINRIINKIIDRSIINDIKLFIFVVDSTHWTIDDEKILNNLRRKEVPVILVVNKVDQIKKNLNCFHN